MFLWFKADIVYLILKTYALPTTVAMNVIGRVITNENAAFGLVSFVGVASRNWPPRYRSDRAQEDIPVNSGCHATRPAAGAGFSVTAAVQLLAVSGVVAAAACHRDRAGSGSRVAGCGGIVCGAAGGSAGASGANIYTEARRAICSASWSSILSAAAPAR
jgi:hypothetical protein